MGRNPIKFAYENRVVSVKVIEGKTVTGEAKTCVKCGDIADRHAFKKNTNVCKECNQKDRLAKRQAKKEAEQLAQENYKTAERLYTEEEVTELFKKFLQMQ